MSVYIEILEEIKGLTGPEKQELTNQINATFGIKFTQPFVGVIDFFPPDEYKQEYFNVIIQEVAADKKISVLKLLRQITPNGLATLAKILSSLPQVIFRGMSKEEAETIKVKLEEAGAFVSLE